MTGTDPNADPEQDATTAFSDIELGIYWDKLTSICDQMVQDLVRTSFSPIIREAMDLSTVIVDRQGNQVSQGTYTIPVFTQSVAIGAKNILAELPPENINEGDVIISNDPWSAETTHEYDIVILRPVFLKDGELVGFTGAVVHLSDIGGRRFTPYAESNFEEGLIVPITKIVESGKLNKDVFNIIEANVRVSEEVMGDIKACLSATYRGADAIREFITTHDIDFDALSEAISTTSRQALEAAIAEMPSGTYSARMPVAGIDTDEELVLDATMEIGERQIHIDYEGTSGQVEQGLNVPELYTLAYTQYPIKCVTTPNIPASEGDYTPIDVTVPEGSLLNPTRPAPIGSRQTIGHFLPVLINRIFKQVIPDEITADHGMASVTQANGQTTQGDEYSLLLISSGGFGARPTKDGLSTTAAPTNIKAASVEALEEKTTNFLYREKRLITDSGGDGKYRGGLGQRIRLECATDHPIALNTMYSRTRHRPQGLLGGHPGALRQLKINGEARPGKSEQVLNQGDVLTLEEAGGGGLYAPEDRARERVVADVKNGYISPETAEDVYGLPPEELP